MYFPVILSHWGERAPLLWVEDTYFYSYPIQRSVVIDHPKYPDFFFNEQDWCIVWACTV